MKPITVEIEEPIFQTSLKLIIWDLSIFANLFPELEFDSHADWYCMVKQWDWTIRMNEFDYITLDHELTHFMAWLGEYLWLDYSYQDELMTYLRWYYLTKLCELLWCKLPVLYSKKKKHAKSKSKRKWLKGIPKTTL